ncbi:DUF6476 family protein [Roseomonas sp. OT10]|uniref:DUF6476 family protein n=1 Tax=Roseomonas cutis TaxID=2897332 RepID=UPI001E45C473|nr:DUF6476 family protein [Roseomonas sp. OT10]UFN47933.1 DUF6476 family protein [Roseomonas sp. OT10]
MRALKVLVVVMGVLIVGGTVTLAVLIVQRMSGAMPSSASLAANAPPVQAALGQPAGSRILGIAGGAEGRVAVWIGRPDGERLLLLDTRSGRTVGEVRLGE